MREEKKQKGMVVLRRAVCLLLSVILLWQLGGSLPAFAGEKNSNFNPVSGKVKMYEWRRVRGDTNFPRDNKSPHYVYMAWPNGNDWYYLHTQKLKYWGKKTDGRWEAVNATAGEEPATSRIFPQTYGYDTDVFTTMTTHGMPRLYYQGTDDDNGSGMTHGGYPTYRIQLSKKNSSGGYDYDKYLNFSWNSDYFYFTATGEITEWGFAPHGSGYGQYSQSANWDGSVAVYYNRKYSDPIWRRRNGAQGMSLTYGSGYGIGSAMYMWMAYEIEMTAITVDYTVTKGSVLNIDGDVVIMDGKMITVEPGGVLSIGGSVINNGYIRNYGTVVLQEGAKVTTFDPVYSLAGEIQCYGSQLNYYNGKNTVPAEGKLVVMKDAILAFDNNKGSLKLDDAAQFVNYGTVVVPYIKQDKSFIENYGNLKMAFRVDNLNSIKNTKAKGDAKTGITLSGGLSTVADSSNADAAITRCRNYDATTSQDWIQSKFSNYGVLHVALPEAAFQRLYPNMENCDEIQADGSIKTGSSVMHNYSGDKENNDLINHANK